MTAPGTGPCGVFNESAPRSPMPLCHTMSRPHRRHGSLAQRPHPDLREPGEDRRIEIQEGANHFQTKPFASTPPSHARVGGAERARPAIVG